MTLDSTSLTPRELLQHARALGVARLDALVLMGHHARRDRSWLLAHDDEPLSSDITAKVQRDLLARMQDMPLAYLVGSKEFFGLELAVGPGVLVPRPDTEVLVQWALEVLDAAAPSTGDAPQRVVDLGTGSGAIALAVKHARPATHVHAVDTSADALAVARTNAERLQLEVTFHQASWWGGEWLHSLPSPIAVAVSNPPYIAVDDPHLKALRHEPLHALVSGCDGLDDVRTIVQGASTAMPTGAWLLLEHGFDQASSVHDLMVRHHFRSVSSRRDASGHLRCTGGQLVKRS